MWRGLIPSFVYAIIPHMKKKIQMNKKVTANTLQTACILQATVVYYIRKEAISNGKNF